MEIQEIKDFLKIENNDEDSFIISLKSAAEEYCKNAGVPKMEDSKLYDLAIKMLVGHWYENRNIVAVGTITKIMEFSLSNILVQLRYSQPVIEDVIV